MKLNMVMPLFKTTFGSVQPARERVDAIPDQKWLAFEAQYWQAFQKEAFNTETTASGTAPVTLSVLNSLMLGKLKPNQEIPGRIQFFFSNMLDANGDGELSRPEWSGFVSKMRQTLADKNLPVPPSHLLLFARAMSDGLYLKKRASQLGLKFNVLKTFEERLEKTTFGLNALNLLNGFDMSGQMSQSSEDGHASENWQVWMKKHLGLAKQWDDLMGLLSPLLSPDQLKQVQIVSCKAFQETGLLPVWSFDESGLLERRVKIRRLKASGKKHIQNIILMSRVKSLHNVKDSPKLKFKTSPWKTEYRLSGIDPEAFRMPALQAYQMPPDVLKQARQNVTQSMVKALTQVYSDHRFAALLSALVQAGDDSVCLDTWQTQLIEPLKKVYQFILDQMKMNPVPLQLMDAFENETGGESTAPGLFDCDHSPPRIVLNASVMHKRLAKLVQQYPEVNDQGQNIRAAQVAYDFLSTLLEEVVHAHQYQVTQDWSVGQHWGFPTERLLDYRDAFHHQGFSSELSAAIYGHEGYYTRQPLELDAKLVVKDVLTEFLPTLL